MNAELSWGAARFFYHPAAIWMLACPACGAIWKAQFPSDDEALCPKCGRYIGFFHRDEISGARFFIQNL